MTGGKRMVKHIILWNLKEEFNTKKIKTEMKEKLEGLLGVVPGLLAMQIKIDPLSTSTADVMLYSELESEQALKNYAIHPAHVEVADKFVRPYTKTRTAMDFEC